MVNNGSSDNCGIASIALSQTSFTCANRVGSEHGHTDRHRRQRQREHLHRGRDVQDNTNPVITRSPANIAVGTGTELLGRS